jgi:hypothetical protein
MKPENVALAHMGPQECQEVANWLNTHTCRSYSPSEDETVPMLYTLRIVETTATRSLYCKCHKCDQESSDMLEGGR